MWLLIEQVSFITLNKEQLVAAVYITARVTYQHVARQIVP